MPRSTQRRYARKRSRKAVSTRGQRSWVFPAIMFVVVLAGVALIAVTRSERSAPAKPPAGVNTYRVASSKHVDTAVDYPQTPPVGGDHNGVWQNCGFYSQPIASENAIHSLEHGAVWITYQPDLPKSQVDVLKALAGGTSYVLVSPYPTLKNPVVASAWGKQLELPSATDKRLDAFVRAYRSGPQTPEPGASCSGGLGTPGR